MEDQVILNAMRAVIKEELTSVHQRFDKLEKDIIEIKEDLEEVRTAANVLLDWSMRAEEAVKVPLFTNAN